MVREAVLGWSLGPPEGGAGERGKGGSAGLEPQRRLSPERVERPAFRIGVCLSDWSLSWKRCPDSGPEGWGVESLRIHKAGGLNPCGFTRLGV